MHETVYTYDDAGRLTGIAYSDGTPSVAYAYDRAGRQRRVASADAAIGYAYGAFGRVVGETNSVLGGVLTRDYDAIGRPAVQPDGDR